VKASANSDVMYSFTSAQDGDPLHDDVRLCLGDDLKKAQDHSTDIAKISRKRLKSDKHRHGKGKSIQRDGRMVSKVNKNQLMVNNG
ncbi:hypothetical protein Tco_0291106, partial [Tanacetum coccineum]